MGVTTKSSSVEFTTSNEVKNATPIGFTTPQVNKQVKQNNGSNTNPATRSKRFWISGRMADGRTVSSPLAAPPQLPNCLAA